MALAAYYAKQKNEELSPKQKAIDKNKNGKIDGFDLSHLRKKTEELSPKQKALDKNKNGKIDGSDLAKLRGEEMSDGDKSSMALRALVAKKKLQQTSGKNKSQAFIDKMVNRSKLLNQPKSDDEYTRKVVQHLKKKYNEETVNEKSDYEVYHKDYSGAVQTAIKQAEKRGYEVDMDDWHDKVATGPKKPSSGKTNSFSINLMKGGKPSKKKLQMQVYNMDNQKYELNMYIEEVEISEAGPGLWANIQAKRQRIKAGSNERMRKPGEKGAPESDALDKARGKNEAASPAQQAAIAIAMKKDGKKPKDMEESDAYDKNVKPSDKPHDKEAAAKRAKLAALAARKKMSEGLMDKIKAMKRGMQAKDKADDHWDKAGDPKNPDAKKDLKKAVRYTNLLNKEEVVVEARKKTLKDMKKKVKTEETPNGSVVKKGEALTGKREPIEINPELKEPAR
jgi:Ca2+-binding EF-hand superfamily protein